MNKFIYLAGTLVVTAVLGIGLYAAYVQGLLPIKPIEEGTVNITPQFEEAIQNMQNNNYEEARNLLTDLENKVYKDDQSYIRLKKMQISLLEKNQGAALEELRSILDDPLVSPKVKSRALENIFTAFLESGKDQTFYEQIFALPQLKHLKHEDQTESLYAYAEYAYDFFPSTILGSSVIVGKIAHLRRIEDQSIREGLAEDVKQFTVSFFEFSEKEIELLKRQPHQEIALINVYTERARVLTRLSRQTFFTVETGLTVQEELEKALLSALTLQDTFYTFYTAYNYIDHVVAYGKDVPDNIKTILGSLDLFTPELIREEEFNLVIKNTSTWSPERRHAIGALNADLLKLVDIYSK